MAPGVSFLGLQCSAGRRRQELLHLLLPELHHCDSAVAAPRLTGRVRYSLPFVELSLNLGDGLTDQAAAWG